ncbi:MAG: hypothetical protein E7393_00605 [Ruminococcaceae bacterium]|nr:hypothetical protein [Oscillospiraceae bacterium]
MVKYLHIMYLDKFTRDFYDFIVKNFPKEEHAFVFGPYSPQYIFDANNQQVLFVTKGHIKQFLEENPIVMQWAKECKLIIINGVFGNEHFMRYLPSGALHKTYLFFWGGDMYSLREKVKWTSFKKRLNQAYRKFIIRHAAGVINLIQGDKEALCDICKPKGKFFVAAMANNTVNNKIFDTCENIKKQDMPIRIMLGNSATPSNFHREALAFLSKYKDEDIEILCTLSYGSESYKNEVIAAGKNIFGNKFVPITEYMSKEEYFAILATAKIGVFYNDRQQGMGNINALLRMGSKVYLRKDTAMWNNFLLEKGYKIFDAHSIKKLSFSEFINFSEEEAMKNQRIHREVSSLDAYLKQWNEVFNSIQ